MKSSYKYQIEDRRSGHERQEQEDRDTPWTCDHCGGRVIECFPGTASYNLHGRFYHIGECVPSWSR